MRWMVDGTGPVRVGLRVNGEEMTLDVEPRTLLVHALRDTLGLAGTKIGCLTDAQVKALVPTARPEDGLTLLDGDAKRVLALELLLRQRSSWSQTKLGLAISAPVEAS